MPVVGEWRMQGSGQDTAQWSARKTAIGCSTTQNLDASIADSMKNIGTSAPISMTTGAMLLDPANKSRNECSSLRGVTDLHVRPVCHVYTILDTLATTCKSLPWSAQPATRNSLVRRVAARHVSPNILPDGTRSCLPVCSNGTRFPLNYPHASSRSTMPIQFLLQPKIQCLMGCSASTATAVMMDPALDGEGSLVKSALQSFSPRLRNVVFVAGGASPSQQAVTQFLVKRLAFTEASFPAIAAMASESGPAKASAFAAGPDSAEDAQAAEAATARKQVAAFLTYLSGLSPGSKVVATGFPSTLAQWKAWQTASPSAASTLLVFSVNGELDAHADSAAPPASSASSAAAAAALAPAPAAGTASSGELAAALLASGLLRRIPTGLPELQALQIAHRAAASLVDPLVKPAPGPGVGGEATDAAQPDGPAPSLQRMGSQQLISAAANAAGIPVTRVLFAVAGPGAGKRQHAQRIAAAGGYTYISAGDLLKAEVARGGAHAAAIADALAKGALVDGDVVCALIERELTARAAAGTVRFLVEGFPRSQANRDAWERLSAGRAITEGVLYLDCPEQVLRARVGQRSEAKGKEYAGATFFSPFFDLTLAQAKRRSNITMLTLLSASFPSFPFISSSRPSPSRRRIRRDPGRGGGQVRCLRARPAAHGGRAREGFLTRASRRLLRRRRRSYPLQEGTLGPGYPTPH